MAKRKKRKRKSASDGDAVPPQPQTPSPETIDAIAAGLGIPPEELEEVVNLMMSGEFDQTADEREWSVGVRALLVPVEGKEDPALVVWAEGPLVVGVGIVDRQLAAEQLEASFRNACLTPRSGLARTPSSIRAETEELATCLRVFLADDFDVEHAPASVVFNDLFEHLLQSLAEDGPLAPAESEPALDPLLEWFEGQDEETVARLKRLTANMVEQCPWERCPPDEGIKVRIEALGIEDGWLAVMGHNGQCFGFQLSRSKADWDTNQQAWERFEQGASPSSLAFLPTLSMELLPADAPDGDGYVVPALAVTLGTTMDLARSRDNIELILAASEAVLDAMSTNPKRFDRAWSRGGSPLNHTCDVSLDRGIVRVEVTVPGAAREATYH